MLEKTPKMKKFEELGEKRVNEAIKRIKLIGKLSNRNNYHYTNGHVKQIIKALDTEIKELRIRFNSDKNAAEANFKFVDKTS